MHIEFCILPGPDPEMLMPQYIQTPEIEHYSPDGLKAAEIWFRERAQWATC